MTKQKSLLRIVTTGSVDDGKSTLMGRLLFETKSIFEDQFEAIRNTSAKRGQKEVDLSLLLDGLAAEREQAITIDVAYRYFETPVRKFIIADCPGHEQYTRNMVTGASTADCAIVLIDARSGVLRQSRRHGFILSLLQVPHVLVVVNKMDQVGFDPAVYQGILDDYEAYAHRLEFRNLTFMPICALQGDNVAARSARMPWYEGPTLLQFLENLHVNPEQNLVDFRFPVQSVIRPNQAFRGFAGRIASGAVRPGEEITVLPSGLRSTVKSIETFDGPLAEAFAPQSVVLTLADEIDVSRGSMLARPHNLPLVGSHLDAVLCWMDEAPLEPGAPYLLKHTSQTVKASISKVIYRFDVDTLHRQDAAQLGLNDLGRVELETTLPLFFDPYKLNRVTGAFILIDPVSNRTVAAGMIRGKPAPGAGLQQTHSPNTFARLPNIPRAAREARNGHGAAVLWLTGLSGAGKTTLGRALEQALHDRNCQTMLLDGDQVRQGLCRDLGFSREDRTENIRRVGEVARLFFDSGHIVICTFISPIAKDRASVRALIPQGRFFEVLVDCPVEVCIGRDPNGLYRAALQGKIVDFTGISAGYEPPAAPEAVAHTDQEPLERLTAGLLLQLEQAGIIPMVS
ncbi:MAG: adenylyl-sulfate kinase [Holophaga sp.]|nr:adenylyl-sulfate kinase [Holophaga sp.]